MRFLLVGALLLSGLLVCGQKHIYQDTTALQRTLDSINRLIDEAVVTKNIPVLEKHYANDFFFKHSTGHEDSKTTWLASVKSKTPPYLSRKHDSTKVELHNTLALVTGTLSVRTSGPKTSGFAIRYIRVYAYQKKTWQLVSHHSTAEWPLEE